MLYNSRWYHHVWNDDLRQKTQQTHLSASVEASSTNIPDHDKNSQITTSKNISSFSNLINKFQ